MLWWWMAGCSLPGALLGGKLDLSTCELVVTVDAASCTCIEGVTWEAVDAAGVSVASVGADGAPGPQPPGVTVTHDIAPGAFSFHGEWVYLDGSVLPEDVTQDCRGGGRTTENLGCDCSGFDTGGDTGDTGDTGGDTLAALSAEAALHLSFDALEAPDRVLDSSPNGFVGTWYDGSDVTTRTVPGVRGDALTFDGVDDFVYLRDHDALDLSGPFTLLAWVRAEPDGTGGYAILDKYAYVGGAWTGYAAYLDGGQPYAGVYSGVEAGMECGSARRGVLDDGAWHHYAATFDGAEVRVLVDGQQAARCDWTSPSTANTDFLEIGARGGEILLRGALDEVLIVPRVVTDAEIAALLTAAG